MMTTPQGPSEQTRKDAQRGDEARQVLDNPAFRSAFDALKARINLDWAECDLRDKERQILLLQMRKVSDFFEASLIGMVEGGKLAHAKIDVDDMRTDSTTRRLLRKVL